MVWGLDLEVNGGNGVGFRLGKTGFEALTAGGLQALFPAVSFEQNVIIVTNKS
jgi:hypothetical protein